MALTQQQLDALPIDDLEKLKFVVDASGNVCVRVYITGGGGGGTWGSITGTLSAQTDLQNALDAKLALAGGSLSGAVNEAKGSDIASATTTDIGAATGNFVDVTGTTTITGLGTVQAGTRRTVRFTGALLLTHHATSLILPTGANITTAAGDTAEFRSLGSGNWVCTQYQRKDGTPLAGGGGGGRLFDRVEVKGPLITGLVTYQVAHAAGSISGVKITVTDLPVGSSVKVDIRKNGDASANSIFTSDAEAEITTGTGATNGVYTVTKTAIDNGTFVADDVAYFRITLVGSTTPGTNLSIVTY